MMYTGEILSLAVAVMWTVTAIVSEIATKRLGVFVANVWRLFAALVCSLVLMWVVMGQPLPVYADVSTWGWMLLSGFIGYFFGDWCLFNSYLTIGSRFGQLFMTLAPIAAALSGALLLGQHLSWLNIVAMVVVLAGIALAVAPSKAGKVSIKGALFGIGAAVGQGLGLVVSKVGMDAYSASAIAQGVAADDSFFTLMPFGANLIRCLAGMLGFLGWIVLRGEASHLKKIFHDGKAAAALGTAVMFGPFLGVGLSLLAVQYTAAGIASTLMALTPVLIIAPSYWIFKQPVTLQGIIGAVISVCGATLFFL